MGKRLPKHRELILRFRKEILKELGVGALFPSQNELAARYGVSIMTVSEAVGALVQDGILERIQGRGTFVREPSEPQGMIGVLTELDICHPGTSPFFLHLIQGIRREIEGRGWVSRFYAGHSVPFGGKDVKKISCQDFYLDLQEGRLTGVVLVGTQVAALQQAMRETGVSIPFVHEASGDVRLLDYGELIRQGVRYLASRRCKTVGFISCGISGENRALFEKECLSCGLEFRPEWQIEAVYRHAQGDGAEALRRLWTASCGRPEGLLVLDDMLYRDLAPMLLHNGIRVPEDVVIVSHMNVRDTRPLAPKPVMLMVDPDEMAVVMVKWLADLRQNRDERQSAHPIAVRLVEDAPTEGMSRLTI